MKKLLIGFVLFIVVCTNNVYAQSLPTFKVGKLTYNNDEISVPLELINNNGFNALGIKITYDTDSLEYIDGNLENLDGYELKGVTENKNHIIVIYAISTVEETLFKGDGVIANLKFRIKEKAVDSSLKINVTDYGTNENNYLDFFVENGVIRVPKDAKVDEKISIKDDNASNYTTSNEDVAEVDENGEIHFVGEGDVTIQSKDEYGMVINEHKYVVKSDTSKNKILVVSIFLLIVVSIISLISFNLISKKKASSSK